MIPISLKEFLRNGAFGPVKGSISRSKLKGLLGSPDDFMCLPRGKEEFYALDSSGKPVHVRAKRPPNADHAGIWKYGSFEFHFNAGRVGMLYADHFDRLQGGSTIRVSPWKLRGQVQRTAIQVELEKLGVGYHVRQPDYDPTQMLLLTDSGVELSFIEKKEQFAPSFGLWAITRCWRSK